MSSPLTITGFSTALFSTWIFVEQWGLLLDAGDGACAGLLQKSRKIKKIAVTHPDRDHLTGLMQLQQLNAQDGAPEIFYPADSGSFPALQEFFIRFDPGRGEHLTWTPVQPGHVRPLAKNLQLLVHPNDHVPGKEGLVKSVAYSVRRETRKLKPEFAALPGAEIAALSKQHGGDYLTQPQTETLLSYAGDSQVHPAARWQGSQILIHEATFLTHEDAGERAERNRHSVLPDVLAMAQEAAPGRLILNHFSSRYSPEAVVQAIRQQAARLGLTFPIYAFLPGQITVDILAQPPVWPAA